MSGASTVETSAVASAPPSYWSVLGSRRWLGALVAAVLAASAFTWLGFWQWGRYEHKHAQDQAIQRNYDQPAAPLRAVIPTTTTRVTVDTMWRPVSVTGTYDEAGRQFIRNRPNANGTYGYEVVWPLTLSDGSILLVDRGWAPNGANASSLPTVAPAPKGTVTVTGWTHWGEPDLDRSLPKGQLASINYSVASELFTAPVNQLYLVLQSEDGVPAGQAARDLTPIPRPATDQSAWVNFSYGWQWWIFAAAAIGIVFWGARKDHRMALADHDPATAPAARPKKVRIWDEEDE